MKGRALEDNAGVSAQQSAQQSHNASQRAHAHPTNQNNASFDVCPLFVVGVLLTGQGKTSRTTSRTWQADAL